MLGKLAWEEKGRENRESNVTLPQEATEGNEGYNVWSRKGLTAR
jgi:hypothetical protein